jgi:hypothetical protein
MMNPNQDPQSAADRRLVQLAQRTVRPGQNLPDFFALYNGLFEQYQPQTTLEESLFFRLVQAEWHLRHADFGSREYRYAEQVFNRAFRQMDKCRKARPAEAKPPAAKPAPKPEAQPPQPVQQTAAPPPGPAPRTTVPQPTPSTKT